MSEAIVIGYHGGSITVKWPAHSVSPEGAELMTIEMTFYCSEQPDGTIHVQNTVLGHLGQHHVHTPEDFERWRGKGKQRIADHRIEWVEGTCECGLSPGEVRDGRL